MNLFTPVYVINPWLKKPEATLAGMSAVQKQPSETPNQNRISYWELKLTRTNGQSGWPKRKWDLDKRAHVADLADI
jgi:hypothetical protein